MPVDSSDNNENAAVRQIRAGICDARREHCGIDVATARLIAASVHRGLGTGLADFAATGGFRDASALRLARMELDLATANEPRWQTWAIALKRFLHVHGTSLCHDHTENTQPSDTEEGR